MTSKPDLSYKIFLGSSGEPSRKGKREELSGPSSSVPSQDGMSVKF